MKRIRIIPIVIVLAILLIGAGGAFFATKKLNISLVATEKMQEPSLPFLTAVVDGNHINEAYGHTAEIDMKSLHETFLPVSTSRKIRLELMGADRSYDSVKYQVLQIGEYTEVDAGNAAVNKQTLQIQLNDTVKKDTDYLLKTDVMVGSRRVSYFYRIHISDDLEVTKKLEFCKKFHLAALRKDPEKMINRYLETELGAIDINLGKVNIKSTYNTVMWEGFTGKVVSEIIPSVHEMNGNIGVFELHYKLQATDDTSKEEYYDVREVFRVRYDNQSTYNVLNYERKVSALFEPDNLSPANKTFKLGISPELNVNVRNSSNGKLYAFVKERELWHFDNSAGKLTKVFAFQDNKTTKLRYGEHQIKIMDIDDNGNMRYIVYGYMNQGKYEGKTGILLNRYVYEDNRNEEIAFIETPDSYQVLKEDIDMMSCISNGNFYFLYDTVLYGYDLKKEKITTVQEGLYENSFAVSKNNEKIAFQSHKEAEEATSLYILDLNTMKSTEVKAKQDERVKILGYIENDVVYGFARVNHILQRVNYQVDFPMYGVYIQNEDGDIINSYERENVYTHHAEIVDTVITLDRVRISRSGTKIVMKRLKSDQIMYKSEKAEYSATVKYLRSIKRLNEVAILLDSVAAVPMEVKLAAAEETKTNKQKQITHVPKESRVRFNYVYTYGQLQHKTESMAAAVEEAYEGGGVVVNDAQQVLWARIQTEPKRIWNINGIKADGRINDIGATLKAILQYQGINLDAENLSETKGEISIYEMLSRYVQNGAIHLTGIPLEHLTYYIEMDIPVVMIIGGSNKAQSQQENYVVEKKATKAVLFTGFDSSYVRYIDPSDGKDRVVLRSEFERLYKQFGMQAVTYIK